MQLDFYYGQKSLHQHTLRPLSPRQNSLGYSFSTKVLLPLRFSPSQRTQLHDPGLRNI